MTSYQIIVRNFLLFLLLFTPASIILAYEDTFKFFQTSPGVIGLYQFDEKNRNWQPLTVEKLKQIYDDLKLEFSDIKALADFFGFAPYDALMLAETLQSSPKEAVITTEMISKARHFHEPRLLDKRVSDSQADGLFKIVQGKSKNELYVKRDKWEPFTVKMLGEMVEKLDIPSSKLRAFAEIINLSDADALAVIDVVILDDSKSIVKREIIERIKISEKFEEIESKNSNGENLNRILKSIGGKTFVDDSAESPKYHFGKRGGLFVAEEGHPAKPLTLDDLKELDNRYYFDYLKNIKVLDFSETKKIANKFEELSRFLDISPVALFELINLLHGDKSEQINASDILNTWNYMNSCRNSRHPESVERGIKRISQLVPDLENKSAWQSSTITSNPELYLYSRSDIIKLCQEFSKGNKQYRPRILEFFSDPNFVWRRADYDFNIEEIIGFYTFQPGTRETDKRFLQKLENEFPDEIKWYREKTGIEDLFSSKPEHSTQMADNNTAALLHTFNQGGPREKALMRKVILRLLIGS